MWWILRTIIFSIIFIGIVHYLYIYFVNNLTTPIVKDLVNIPSNKYKNIYEIINNKETKTENENNSITNYDLKDLVPDLLPAQSVAQMTDYFSAQSAAQTPAEDMKNELKSFLNEQLYLS